MTLAEKLNSLNWGGAGFRSYPVQMLYQFADPFDHYNTPTLMYETVSGTVTISSAFTRFPAIAGFPNQGINVVGGGVRKNLKSNCSTLIYRLSFGIGAMPFNNQILLSLWDTATLQCFLGITPTGALQFYTQVATFNPVPIGPSSPLGLIAPTTGTKPNHGVEIVVIFAAGSGSVACYLDGALVIPLTGGLTTIKSGNAYANQIGIGAPNSLGFNNGLNVYADWLCVWDNTGSSQNAALGFDFRKLTKLPVGAGDLTQWAANGAASNFQCVNENPPDDDTTYVSSSSPNSDSYAMGTAGFSGVPSTVVAKSRVRKDDANTRSLQIGVRSAGSNGLGSTYTLGTSYVFIDSCIPVDPATGLVPTSAAADAYQHLKSETA